MPFHIRALSASLFAPLARLSDEALAEHGALRQRVTSKPGFPCRVSLADAEIGEDVLLVNYMHQPAASPYRASHAIYVRPGAVEAEPGVGEVPDVLRSRTLSLRAFDAAGIMVDADLVEGRAIEALAERMMTDVRVATIHAHFARRGCYAARIDRA